MPRLNRTRYTQPMLLSLILMLAACKAHQSQVKVLYGSPSSTDFPASVGVSLNAVGAKAQGAVTCTGTFIRDDLVLTAGHCFTDHWTNGAVLYDNFDANGPIFNKQSFHVPTTSTYDDFFAIGLPASQTVYLPSLYKANKFDSNILWIDLAIVRFAKGTAGDDKIAKLAAASPKPGASVTLIGYGLTDSNNMLSGGVRTKGTNTVVANTVLPVIEDPEHKAVTDQRLLSMIRLDGRSGGGVPSPGAGSVSAPGDSGGSLYNAAGELAGAVEAAGPSTFPGADYSSVAIDLNQPEVAAFIKGALADTLTAEPLDDLKPPLCRANDGQGYGCTLPCGGDLCAKDDAGLSSGSICRPAKAGAQPC